MKEHENKRTSRGIDPEKFGMWEGCRGEFYTAGCVCRICGKTRADHCAAGLPSAEPQRTAEKTLEPPAEIQIPVCQIDAPCRIIITRGHGSAGPLDYDNLVGGLKALRDQITEKVLGRQSDAEKDGIEWIYRQEPGHGCKVEIFQKQIQEEQVK